MYKPKQEVKEVASRLALHAEQLKNKELMRWLGEVDKENRVSESEQKWRNENECLRQHIQAMEESHRNDHRGRSTAGTQCQECRKESQKKERRDGLTQHLNFETFQMITEVDWGNEIFPKMNVESGHIWEAPNEYDIILPCIAKFGSLENEVSSAITKFGGEDGLRRQNKTKGDVAMMLHSLGFPREDGSFLCSPRYIYYPITTDGIGTKEAEDIDVFQSIVQIRNHILKNKKTKVALPELNGVGGMMLGRIVEYLFVNTNVEVKIYKPVKSQKLPTQDSTQANSQSSKQNTVGRKDNSNQMR
ncbi:hypothetical protein JTB14_008599 [Gonioctena quinquepunctata]|nr:hypothetical protein JTB14_008599 [Gonioctena quinquepunctata]